MQTVITEEVKKVDKFERFLRQVDILKPETCIIPIFIIGAGATGSFVALSLAKMGFEDIRVWDEDKVEEHNFPNQIFPIEAKGQNKATALQKIVEQFTEVKIDAVPLFYTNQPVKGIVISCVDSMKIRKKIYTNALKTKDKVKLIIDPRTGPELFRVITTDINSEAQCKYYESTLHSDAEADETPCTARAIIYSVLAVSAFICKQVKAHCMNQEFAQDLLMDMRNDVLLTLKK